MATARPGRSRRLTPERARENLIHAGFPPLELDSLMDTYAKVVSGESMFPVTADQALTETKRAVAGRAASLERLAGELDKLWTPKGVRLLREEPAGQETVLSLPDHLRAYAAILRGVLNDGGDKLPAAKKQIKVDLIRRAKESTGNWHDAELAALCGDTTENWASWRKRWYKQQRTPGLPPPPAEPQ